MSSTEEMASALLATMRATPMRRGEVARSHEPLQRQVAQVLEHAGLPASVAWRVARQLVFKCDLTQLDDAATCAAMGRRLVEDLRRLQTQHGLSARQAAEILAKLSPEDVDAFVTELQVADRTIARTIFNAAVEAANPRATGRRYLEAYQQVASQIDQLDPSVARTLANATFTARTPRRKALEHFARFTELLKQLEQDPALLRRVARLAFRTTDPVAAAERIVKDYQDTVSRLTANGIDLQVARMVAQSTHFRSTAQGLLQAP
jgi:hypothetical protein